MIKTIIVDDDTQHLDSLSNMLNAHFKHVDIIATSNSIADAVKKIDALKPQLVFLDIEMGSLTGFDLLEMIRVREFEVIFTTCYQKYAIQAIKASALDFVEKPLNLNELSGALKRYKEKTGKIRMNNLLENFKINSEDQKIALTDKNGLNFYKTKDIIRCQSDNSYTEFFILNENDKQGQYSKIVVSKGFDAFEDFLVEKGFFYRIHNQHLININHIKKYVKEDGGYIIMDDNSNNTIPLARARKEDFIDFLRRRGIIL
jgi:two-component system LytT family response regulator